MTYNDYGIIFKIKDFGEADKLVSVLTKGRGRIDTVAKGARKPLSRKTSSIDIMNKGKFSFAEGKNLDILLEIDLDNLQIVKNDDLTTSKYIFVISELIDRFFPEVSQGEEVFDLLSELLEIAKKKNMESLLLSFELKLMNLTGFGPNTHTCNLCNDELKEDESRVAHAGSEIGFICAKHLEKNSGSLISDKLLKIIKYYLNSELADAPGLRVSESDFETLKKLHRLWIQSIIGKEIKSYNFLDR